jgi:uncharacterized membrane protein YphA (DoxX/SURF4 family)
MKKLITIGRILFAVPFGILGINHFIMRDYYLGMLTSFVPGMGFTLLLVGLALIAVCVCLLINRFVKIACILLAFLLGLFIITIHIPNLFDPAKATVALIELMKDTALMGGALIIAGIYDLEKH